MFIRDWVKNSKLIVVVRRFEFEPSFILSNILIGGENMKKKRNLIVVLAMALILAIGMVSAYFTDTTGKTNNFTVGNISIDLTETNFDEEAAKNITPNQTIEKNPQIVNDGANDAYVFMSVEVPKANVATANADGSKNSVQNQELFTYEINSDWMEVSKTEGENSNTYIYAYASADEMTTLSAGDTTSALFDNVTLINVIEGQLDGQELAIDINVMGIQNSDLGTSVPSEVLGILNNQNQ